MNKRQFILGSSGIFLTTLPTFSFGNEDKFGASRGYPSGWATGRLLAYDPALRVGNYSGGFEQMLPFRRIQQSTRSVPLSRVPERDIKYQLGLSTRSIKDYLGHWPITGLLVCRNNQILFEQYRFSRTDKMRFTGWSMAKSITSLLLGICIDKKLIRSFDDTAATYISELSGTLHGETTLRNLSNMSSGANVSHDKDTSKIINPQGLLNADSSISKLVAFWNQRKEDQGARFNYNELCPLTIGMVIRRVTGRSLSEFAAEMLWEPLGAEADATWSTDSERNEFNCIGFAAALRDWGRLGQLVANRGRAGEIQIVSESWIRECTSWGPQDKQVRVNVAVPGAGYKALFWHAKSDGSRPSFRGYHGQRLTIDMPTGTVVVQTAVDHEGPWAAELNSIVDAAASL